MRVKVLSLAVAVSIFALPVPASQMLAGTFSAPSAAVHIVAGRSDSFGLLIQDPFLIDQMRLGPPVSPMALDLALRAPL